MITDFENTFFPGEESYNSTGTTIYSDVVDTVKTGDAYNQLYLAMNNLKGTSGQLTVELQTSDSASSTLLKKRVAGQQPPNVTITSPTVLGTYKLDAKKGSKLTVLLPYGLKRYVQLKVTASASINSNVLFAALTPDVDLR